MIDLKLHSNRQVYCCASNGHWSRVQRQYLDTVRMCPVTVRPYGSTSKKEYQLAVKGISVTKLSGSYLRRHQDDVIIDAQPGWMSLRGSSRECLHRL